MTEESLGMLGKYQVLEEIGRGGFSVVYRAEHPRLKKTVAIKLMLPALFSDPEAIQRFIHEARTVAALKQENITQVLDLAEEQGRLYMVMEYLPGGDLHAWQARRGKLSFRRAVEVLGAIAAALDYAHSQNVVHGDVKPGNILMNLEGSAKLTDFGVLRAVENSGVTSADMTRGTPYYISPEQAEGGVPTPLSDQYALGVVAYELLTGRVPFEGDTPLTIYLKHVREPLQPASQLNPLITPALEAALHKALEKDPKRRYPDCRAFARALREAVAATETEQFQDLMKRAEQALAAHQPENARPLIESALQIQPDDAQARALLEDLQARERAQRGYQGATEAVFTARNAARILTEQPTPTGTLGASPPPDPDGLVARLAPPPPPAWKKLLLRWQLGLILALGLCVMGGIVGLGDVAYTSQRQGEGELRRQTLVAGVRTSTPTATFTPTFTPTNTPTPTLTFTPTNTPTPTLTFTPTLTPTPATWNVVILMTMSNKSEEYQHIIANFKNNAPAKYNLIETTTSNADELKKLLDNAHVLLIPEPEDAESAKQEKLGTTFGPLLIEFVQKGGRVVSTGEWVADHSGFLRATGLLNTKIREQIDPQSVQVVNRDNILSVGLPTTFNTLNGSSTYSVDPSETNFVVIAAYKDEPFIITKQIGLGNVIQIGADYFETNVDLDRVLMNAIFWIPQPSVLAPTITPSP